MHSYHWIFFRTLNFVVVFKLFKLFKIKRPQEKPGHGTAPKPPLVNNFGQVFSYDRKNDPQISIIWKSLITFLRPLSSRFGGISRECLFWSFHIVAAWPQKIFCQLTLMAAWLQIKLCPALFADSHAATVKVVGNFFWRHAATLEILFPATQPWLNL